jgi:hypothetical protein
MKLLGKRLGWDRKQPGEEVKTKAQRLSAVLFSPTYLLSVGVLLCAAMPAFKVPVNSFNEGVLGTLTTYIRHTKAPDWRKRFALLRGARTINIRAWIAKI